jgi:hypothetical protein
VTIAMLNAKPSVVIVFMWFPSVEVCCP